MSGEPQKIHLQKDAIPYAVLTPIPIPHYWKKEVEQQLMNNVKLGILRPAPLNEPNEWCMRMITVKKKDGKPRRAIDYQQINILYQRSSSKSTSIRHSNQYSTKII